MYALKVSYLTQTMLVPFRALVPVVVRHAICSDPARYELVPQSDLRSSDVY
jgi:hypothetical protein